LDISDKLNRDSAVDEDCIRERFALDIEGIVEAVDLDLEMVFVEGDSIVEGAKTEDSVGLDLGNGDGVVDKKSIGGS
jgi:hypothetical protein